LNVSLHIGSLQEDTTVFPQTLLAKPENRLDSSLLAMHPFSDATRD